MLLTICKCCGAGSLLCVTFLAVPISRRSGISSLQGEVPVSKRCPGEQLGYRQTARSCKALPAIPPGVSQASHRAAWHWSNSVPVPGRIWVTGSGCAWPG